MTDPSPRFGVCTLRVEVQPEHLLITVTAHRFAGPGARQALPAQSRTFASVPEAMAATRRFLEDFGTWQEGR